MAERNLIITQQDHDRLVTLIREYRQQQTGERENLDALERELNKAQIVSQEELPADVVTMRSTVKVRSGDAKRRQTYTIVYPHEADIDRGYLSVLAPISTALLGYRVGDEVTWEVPAGQRHYHIEEVVYQPEAAGDRDR